MARDGRTTIAVAVAAVCMTFLLWHVVAGRAVQQRRRSDDDEDDEKDADDGQEDEEPASIPLVDLATYLATGKDADACRDIANALHHYGVVICRDPRVSAQDNDRYLDMMERYFALSDGVRDARPEYSYQVGVTPSGKERPRNHCARMGTLGPGDKPLSPCPPELDPKWRFFWRIGPLPPFKTRFPALNMDPVIPPEIPRWRDVMDTWGSKMLACLNTAAEMAAVGFALPPDAFTRRMQYGPHLLAPTGSDFAVFHQEGTVLAGYHYDLNFLTIHGKSRYPGLYIWTRSGRRRAVAVPDGCLLIQAGKQLEYLTAGHVLAGFHEVVRALFDLSGACCERSFFLHPTRAPPGDLGGDGGHHRAAAARRQVSVARVVHALWPRAVRPSLGAARAFRPHRARRPRAVPTHPGRRPSDRGVARH
jgi:isopenicillin N synthase-like dioxygenase